MVLIVGHTNHYGAEFTVFFKLFLQCEKDRFQINVLLFYLKLVRKKSENSLKF